MNYEGDYGILKSKNNMFIILDMKILGIFLKKDVKRKEDFGLGFFVFGYT